MKENYVIEEQHGMPFCSRCLKVFETAGNQYICIVCGLKVDRESWNKIFQKRVIE